MEKDHPNNIDYIKIKEIVNEVLNEKASKLREKEELDDEQYGVNLRPSNRIEKKDMKFFSSIKSIVADKTYYVLNGNKFNLYLFTRAVAKNIVFENVDFSKSYFEKSYLKDCRFIRCNFEGAIFSGSNLIGSYFENCNFDYVIFEKTFIDDEIFNCAPLRDNLRYKFARSLKLNYASIGDYIKSSRAVTIELAATKSHLRDSWLSGDEWYKLKYGGIKRRFEQFCKWLKVSFLDFLWGNGESLWRLVRFNFIIFAILTLFHVIEKSVNNTSDILDALFIKIPSNYFGLIILDNNKKNFFEYYPTGLSLFLVVTRLISFGLLMSIIIKKYYRR